MKKFVFLLIILFPAIVLASPGQAILSDSTRISLLTYTPGSELYTLFGHSAIRVRDPVNNLDMVYNYGTFDFSTPNFYLKFIKGNLMYQLSRSTFQQEYYHFTMVNHTVYQQNMNLNQEEKQLLFNNLEINYLPENRMYKYNFFYDNCATRIRDIIEQSVHGELVYLDKPPNKKSFRELIYPYIKENEWINIGINVLLGSSADRLAKPRDYMFLPAYLQDMLSGGVIIHDSVQHELLEEPVMIHQGFIPQQEQAFMGSAVFFFWLLLLAVVILTLLEFGKNKRFKGLDKFLLSITGLLGLFSLILWAWSEHEGLSRNMDLLWAFPANLAAAFIPSRWRDKNWFRWYMGLLVVLLLIYLFFVPMLLAFAIPLVLIFLIRYLKIFLDKWIKQR